MAGLIACRFVDCTFAMQHTVAWASQTALLEELKTENQRDCETDDKAAQLNEEIPTQQPPQQLASPPPLAQAADEGQAGARLHGADNEGQCCLF